MTDPVAGVRAVPTGSRSVAPPPGAPGEALSGPAPHPAATHSANTRTAPPATEPQPSDEAPRSGGGFTHAGVARGARAAVPLLLGLTPFALVVGVISAGRGLTLAETALMNALVFAGTAQLLALELWRDPAPWLAVMLTSLFVGLRMLPMAAALTPWFTRARGWRTWLTLGLLTDHGFALSIPEERAGRRDAGFLLGTGLMLWAGWLLLCIAGYVLGGMVRVPPGHALFFAAPAAFIALLVPIWRGPARDLLPWLMAAALALAAYRLPLPAPMPLLIGALGGAALGAWRRLRAPESVA